MSGLAGETVECGVCLLGTYTEFADAVRYGASAGIVDYSKKTVDDFGNVQITERAFSKRASWQMLVANTDIDNLQRMLASLRATPALYIGSDRFDATPWFTDSTETLTSPSNITRTQSAQSNWRALSNAYHCTTHRT